MPSFSVRCIFKWQPRADQTKKYLYEERITLWQAATEDEAIDEAEREARAYAGDEDEYLNYCQCYALPDDVPVSGVEVFSLLRESDLEVDDYLAAFFAAGGERRRAV